MSLYAIVFANEPVVLPANDIFSPKASDHSEVPEYKFSGSIPTTGISSGIPIGT